MAIRRTRRDAVDHQPTPSTTTTTSETATLVGFSCWAIQPLSLVLEVVVGLAARAPHSWVDITISDLGAWLLLRRPDGRLAQLPIALWAIYGLSGVLTGLIPLDVDLEQHYLVSTPAVLLGGIAVATTARALGRLGWAAARGWVVVGVVSTLASVLLTLRLDPTWGGLLERVGIWPSALALAFVAWQVHRRLPRWRAAAEVSARLDQ